MYRVHLQKFKVASVTVTIQILRHIYPTLQNRHGYSAIVQVLQESIKKRSLSTEENSEEMEREIYLVTFSSNINWFIQAVSNQCDLVGSHHVNNATTFNHPISPNKNHVDVIHGICNCWVNQEFHRNIEFRHFIWETQSSPVRSSLCISTTSDVRKNIYEKETRLIEQRQVNS